MFARNITLEIVYPYATILDYDAKTSEFRVGWCFLMHIHPLMPKHMSVLKLFGQKKMSVFKLKIATSKMLN